MRQATVWVGCFALVSAMGCRGSAPAPTNNATAAPTPGCNGTTACTVIFSQAGDLCKVEPMELPIKSGYTVRFVTQVSDQTVAASVKPKPVPNDINFEFGPPGRIDRGRDHNSGVATGPDGAKYNYNVSFDTTARCLKEIDPVICIKPGGDFQDTCE